MAKRKPPHPEQAARSLALKRVYDPPDTGDGTRVLVDRLWPRGIAKAEARVDLWLRDLMRKGPVTLLYAARDAERNNAAALRDWLRRKRLPRRRQS